MKSTYLAEQTASSKAMEYVFPPEVRLYDDPYSVEFSSSFNKFFIRCMKLKRFFKLMIWFIEKSTPGVYGGLVCRTRYMDDALLKAIEDGFDAVVNLGGGYDTRCLRLKNMEKIEYYHIDLPEAIDSYREIMKGLPTGIPTNVRFIPIDFDVQNLEEELINAGYDKTKKTLFIWEGVTQYISEEAMISTFKYIASTKAGNRVVFSYVLKKYLTNPESFPRHKKVYAQIKMFGIKWINGLSPESMRDDLNKYGLNLIEDVGATEYEERYLKPIGREMEIMPIERVSLAEVI